MYQNFSLRQNMQIPHENVHVTGTAGNSDAEIYALSKNYQIHKPPELKEFIKDNAQLIQYINAITPLINNQFPNYKKCITFCKDPEFDELEDVTIYINSFKEDFDRGWKKLDELEKELFGIDEFSNKIKGLVSLDLWIK